MRSIGKVRVHLVETGPDGEEGAVPFYSIEVDLGEMRKNALVVEKETTTGAAVYVLECLDHIGELVSNELLKVAKG